MISARNVFLEAGILLSVFFAPLCFGAVYSWAYLALAALFFLLFAITPDSLDVWTALPRIFRSGLTILLMWAVVQTCFFSISRTQSRYELLLWGSFFCLFLVCQKLSRSAVLRILWAVTLAGGFESAYGLFQVLSGQESVLWQAKVTHVGFVTGTYLNRNNYAGLMELVIGIQCGLFLRAMNKRQRVTALFLMLFFLINAFGLIRSGSRMGLTALLISMFIHFNLVGKRSFRSWLVLFLLVSGCLGGAAWLMRDLILARIAALGGSWSTWDGRLIAWQGVVHLARDYFWTGSGLGSFQWVYPLYQSEKLVYGWDHAHNDYLELAAELGVPAFLAGVAAFFSLWRHFWGHMDRKDFSSFALILGGMTGMAALCLHGLTDFNFSIPANAMLFVLTGALLFRLLNFERQKILVKKGYE